MVDECERQFARATNAVSLEEVSTLRTNDGTALFRVGPNASTSFAGWKYVLGCTSPEFRPYWAAITRARRFDRVTRILRSYGAAGLIAGAAIGTQAYLLALAGLPFVLRRIWCDQIN